jgi:prepilin-type processing-associated H-X9-DG protein
MTDTNWSIIQKAKANYVAYWDVYGEDRGDGTGLGVAYRHMEGAVVQFFDTHVEHLSKQRLFTDSAAARSRIWDVYQ